MMDEASDITQVLLDRAGHGDVVARHELLERFRQYLRSLIAVRLDRRVARRVDASDIVQEALADASERMEDYLRVRPLPFLDWLRRLARDRVVDAHRRHLGSLRRSVARERSTSDLTDASVAELGRRLLAPDTSPSNRLDRRERFDRIAAALARLQDRDREVLVLWYLEQRDTREIAKTLGITERGVRSRHLRALLRLRSSIDGLHPTPNAGHHRPIVETHL
jgi:RNA polymerase sigma-70 factor, ECF subfamily